MSQQAEPPLLSAPQPVVLHLFRFLAEPSCLASLASVCLQVSECVHDSGSLSMGHVVWREAFLARYWRPAQRPLDEVAVAADFRWQRECIRRLRFMCKHFCQVKDQEKSTHPYFVSRENWVQRAMLPDNCWAFAYNVHNIPEVQRRYDGHMEISQGDDTVAIINTRSTAVMATEALHDAPERSHLLCSVWRARLPGARRLRYYEMEVLNTGEHGYIACGAVRKGRAHLLRMSGQQPGWGFFDAATSLAYHGDDGRLYPGLGDRNGRYLGTPFGPCFSAPCQGADLAVRPGEPPPPGAVLAEEYRPEGSASGRTRVVGMGLDLDRDCFFFTLDGALVGEVLKEGIPTIDCVPVIGLHSPGELVRLNTGLAPFWFPVEAYSVDASAVPRWENPRQWAQSLDSSASTEEGSPT